MALMFSTQSVDEATRRGDRLVVLAAGRLLFAGTAEEMMRRPRRRPATARRRPSWHSCAWSPASRAAR